MSSPGATPREATLTARLRGVITRSEFLDEQLYEEQRLHREELAALGDELQHIRGSATRLMREAGNREEYILFLERCRRSSSAPPPPTSPPPHWQTPLCTPTPSPPSLAPPPAGCGGPPCPLSPPPSFKTSGHEPCAAPVQVLSHEADPSTPPKPPEPFAKEARRSGEVISEQSPFQTLTPPLCASPALFELLGSAFSATPTPPTPTTTVRASPPPSTPPPARRPRRPASTIVAHLPVASLSPPLHSPFRRSPRVPTPSPIARAAGHYLSLEEAARAQREPWALDGKMETTSRSLWCHSGGPDLGFSDLIMPPPDIKM
ncbi:hypothetical protein B0H11DRAFT_2231849 [Mycena galericulata]|nr:hypothetical protein B0H11DRAFT_2231849 [Mycena galericulata]